MDSANIRQAHTASESAQGGRGPQGGAEGLERVAGLDLT